MRLSTFSFLLVLGTALILVPDPSCGQTKGSRPTKAPVPMNASTSPKAPVPMNESTSTEALVPMNASTSTRAPVPTNASGQPKPAAPAIETGAGSFDELMRKHLLFPVAGGSSSKGLRDTFTEARGTQRIHHALDIPAKRGTPVLSTDNGRVIKLFTSKAGGLTVYAADPTERFIYYYAHLDGYRTGLKQGTAVLRGDTLGYVGTTGNAPPNTPHLHFAIFRSDDIKQWSKGVPINPFKIFAFNNEVR